jgi:hypothetical protein
VALAARRRHACVRVSMLPAAAWHRQAVAVHSADAPRSMFGIRTSSACTGGSCVGVSIGEEVVVADTKMADGPVLRFSRDEWADFLVGVKNGEFDLL